MLNPVTQKENVTLTKGDWRTKMGIMGTYIAIYIGP